MRMLLVVLTIVVGAFFFASSAPAGTSSTTSTQRSTFGQCGSAVHSGTQLVNAWRNMNVLGSTNARSIVASSGWTSMDGTLADFVSQRGKEFQLASPAWIEDFGCNPGNMFSVGMRHYGAGEWIIGIVPAQFAPSQVSGHPCPGCVRKIVFVHAVGRGNCANGFRKLVAVYVYVHVHVKHVKKAHKTKTQPKTKPKSPTTTVNCPSGTTKDSAGNCVAVVVNCPTGSVKDSNGNCVAQTNTAAQACQAKGGNWDNTTQMCTIIQVNGTCSTIIVVNGNGNTVNTSTTGNCNTNNPPPPPVNHAPTIQWVNLPAHTFTKGQVQVCVLVGDADGNSLTVWFSAQAGTVSTASRPDPSGSPGKWCTSYTAPSNAGVQETLTATVSDGQSVTAIPGSFPIVVDSF